MIQVSSLDHSVWLSVPIGPSDDFNHFRCTLLGVFLWEYMLKGYLSDTLFNNQKTYGIAIHVAEHLLSMFYRSIWST